MWPCFLQEGGSSGGGGGQQRVVYMVYTVWSP
jgi:hypothetical protein